ncbi:MAG: lipopolysaccharide biosynthesis protein [Planctomycetota bacterium]
MSAESPDPKLPPPPLSKPSGATSQPRHLFAAILSRLPVTVLWALVAQALISITRLLTSMTVGGRFGSGSEEQLGYYSNAFSVLMILIAVFEALITTPLTVFNQKERPKDRPVFSGHMMMSAMLLLGLIAACAAIWISLEYSFRWLPPELAAVLIAVVVIAPIQLLREFARRWLLANLQARPAAWLEVLFAGLFLATLFVMVTINQVTAVYVFVLTGIVNLVGLLAWWKIFRKQFSFQRDGFQAQLQENVRYGRWVAGENVCSALTMYFCNWYLMFRIDEAAAGVFFACFTVVLLANPFLLGVCSILAPRAAAAFNQSGKRGLIKVLTKFGLLILTVLGLFSVLLWFFGEPITNLFFGPKYDAYFQANLDGNNWITAVLSLAMPLMGISYVSAFGLLAINRPFDNFYSAIAALLVLVTIAFSFSEPTLMTAAISFVASFFVAALCRTVFLVRAIYGSEPSTRMQ